MKTFGFDEARKLLAGGNKIGIKGQEGNSYYIFTGVSLLRKTEDGTTVWTHEAYPFDWPDRTDFYLYEKVSFNKAWDHLKIGKIIEKDGKIYSFDPLRHALCVWKHEGGDISAGWHRLSEGIPIEWINATDFELVEG